MVTRTDQLLRKAMRGYLEHLGNMPLAERITNAAVFEDVYRFLLNGSGRLELRRADVAAVRVFLWNYQYRRCAVTGKPLRLASAVLDHCHRTGRVRAVVHRSANAAEGGRYVGRRCGFSTESIRVMVENYRVKYVGVGVIYPG
ncbi:hypothetical protein E7735_24380 [Enterobacter cloacae]|uniref:endonuclease domain-containing protein n=1 Tax=Enterobacter cloacae TaxID=550 RepID=UPI0010A48EC6|nr:endonuclease domain-containing protein [Enterobacter cloacae]QCC93911.1 hypothetical protein E7735_24380 [Enterobacter cloacae]QCC98913.1 hypothetical protein E7739_24075 [Enterobacter cloacae]QCD09151.1 hypothetical protein E7729_00485 [Enterobacter cloacae]